MSTGLSKSLILKGIQCPKALYLQKNPPDFELPPQPDLEATLRAGREVGVLAQQLFPGGSETPIEGLSVHEQIERTQHLIDSGVSVIYEASFDYDGTFVKVDILAKNGNTWQIHEVKMSTSVKEVNLDDVAIQYYVLTQSGLTVSGAFLVHINKEYVRQGEIDVQQLFASEDVLEEVLARQAALLQIIADLRNALQDGEPQIDIGPYCNDPYACDFIPYCWQHVPENSIFELRGNGVKKWSLYERGIIRFDQIPLDELNKNQRHQVEATLSQQDSIDRKAVAAFLNTLWYPLYHLDFETFNTAIPKYDGIRPYQQVPFQYSLHVQKEAGAEAQHFEFLAEPNTDPRRALVEQLLKLIPEEGCVLTYNQTFEKGVLRELASLFPDLAKEINKRLENVRDLMVPFRKRDVYKWQMRGSYSIKEVLPAMVPDLSYSGMVIADGVAAMQAYHDMCTMEPGTELTQLRTAMLEYCRLDTLAMVRILGETVASI